MKSAIFAGAALAALGLAACSRSDPSPRPAHSEVAADMPGAAVLPGAQGPALKAPHAPPPTTATLSDVHPQPGGPATGTPPPPSSP